MTTDRQPPEIENRPEAFVVGTVGDYTMETRHTIPAQWEAFFQAGYEIGNAVPGAMYGVSYGADGAGAFRYGVGVAVSARPDTLPEGTCAITLSAGDYAVLRAFGPVAELPESFDWMFSTWLPGSGRQIREGAVFERYPDDSRNGPDGMAYEIWVPVAQG